jgi:DNA-binding MarR family transcriptional regulator
MNAAGPVSGRVPRPRAEGAAGRPGPRAEARPEAEHLAAALVAELLAAEQMLRARLSRALPKGMELSHFAVLNHLAQTREERGPAELARAFRVTRGAMSNTLARLEWAGHVHVRPDWDDARRKRVALSPAGRAARDAAVAAIQPVMLDAVGGTRPERLRATLAVLREMRATLSAEGEADGDGV